MSQHARRRPGAPAPVRGRRVRVLHHAPGIHARRAGSRAQDDQHDGPVLLSACRGVDASRGRLPAPAGASEWQGTAAALIKAAYGGDGLPSRDLRGHLRARVLAGGGADDALPRGGRARVPHLPPHARHRRRSRTSISTTYEKFAVHRGPHQGARHRSRQHAAREDRVRRVLGRRARPRRSRISLQGQGSVRDAAGAVLRPGRPIADPGPGSRELRRPTRLSAAGSLFASSLRLVDRLGHRATRAGATLTDANTAQPTFNANADGTYVLQLVASNGAAQSAPAQLTLVVRRADPGAVRHPLRRHQGRDAERHVLSATRPTAARRGRRSTTRTRTATAMASRRRDRRPVVLRRGARPHQFHGDRRQPAAAQALGQPPQRRPAIPASTRPPRPGSRRARTTTCSSTGSSTARRSSGDAVGSVVAPRPGVVGLREHERRRASDQRLDQHAAPGRCG